MKKDKLMLESHLFRGNDRVLVVAAHPDDEVLGCGGSIARHIECGDAVTVVLSAEGVTSRDSDRNASKRLNELQLLRQTASKANNALGVNDLRFLGFPDNRMDEVPLIAIVKEIENIKSEINPTIVYTHFPLDLNIDHRLTAEAVLTAFRPQPNENLKILAFFEVLSSTNWSWQNPSSTFSANMHLNIEKQLNKKIDALAAYECEMRDWPHSRSIEALRHLAALRGSNVGVAAAEAFVIARWIA
jgi:LmbE family N-acetylglucosaminyl deacetylase